MAEPAPYVTSQESAEQRELRLAWERARIAEADADIAAGRVISGDEALEWLDRWAAGEDLAEPNLS
jgi:predicted transcriptional regulator